jgi:signal transduction histidine kinase/CheY-like chemotaxis protein
MSGLSLKTRATLLLPLAISVGLAALLLLVHAYLVRFTKASISTQQYLVVSILGEDIDASIANLHRSLVGSAARITRRMIEHPSEALAHLKQDDHFEPFDNGIFLQTREGRILAELPLGLTRSGWDFSYRDFIRETIATRRPVLSEPYVSSQAHHPAALMFTAPIFDTEGAMIGILGGSIDLSRSAFIGRLSRIKLAKGEYLFLANQDRVMISHPEQSRILKLAAAPGQNPLFDRAVAGFDGSDETVTSRGGRVLTSFRHLKTKNWILAASYPLAEIYAPIRRLNLLFWLLLPLVSLGTFLLMRKILARFTAPILELTAQVERLGTLGGDPAQLKGEDEIATLAKTFNRLLREIDQQAQLKEQLHHAHKMEVIGQMAGGIAHDFNNMLAGILAAAELLQERLSADDKNQKMVNLILNAARRSADLTHNLLALARRAPKDFRPVAIDVTLKTVAELLERTIDKNIRLDLRLEAGAPVVQADQALLQNALLNLAFNARDAMPDGGTLTLATARTVLTEEDCQARHLLLDPGVYLEIAVTDTGIGMAPELLGRIFEPFFTTKAVGKGTGLGLAAVYGTVRDHQGNIVVNSEPGRGTTFRLYLPLVSAEVEQAAGSTQIIHGTGGILLIDDEEILRTAGKGLLEALGYTVFLAENGRQGLEAYAAHPGEIQLVLLDMVMPVLSGMDTFQALRELDPGVRVLFCSGFHREGTARDLTELGAKGFLMKPFSMIKLSHQVARAMGVN